MKKLKLLITALSLLSVRQIWAQDPMFSQVFFNKMVYNPAYTGNQLGVSGLMAHRSQWTAIPSVFNTSNVQFASSLPHLNAGIGGMITHNIEGGGKLRTLSLDLMGSKVIRVVDNTNEKLFTYFGLGASINQKSVNWNNFVFGDQLDQVNGITDNTSNAQVPTNESQLYPDFNTGLAIKGLHREIYYNLGFSVDHILSPNESIFQTEQGRLPRKYVLDLFMGMPFHKIAHHLHKDFFWVPGFVLQSQASFQTALIGSSFKHKHFVLGAWYKSRLLNFSPNKSDAIVLNTALLGSLSKNYNYVISYSYDASINNLITNSAGSHEITLIISHFQKEKYQSAKYMSCAKFEGPNETKMPFIW